jgi:hypothetical protein
LRTQYGTLWFRNKTNVMFKLYQYRMPFIKHEKERERDI